MREVFAREAEVITDPLAGTPLVLPVPARRRRGEPARGGGGTDQVDGGGAVTR